MGNSLVENLDQLRSGAFDAVARDDYFEARKLALKAQLLLATIPDGSIQGLSTQTWDRRAIDAFLLQLDRIEAIGSPTGGVVVQAYGYAGERGL
ncbi:MAG: hypothetical protein U0996_24980 [Planctomycetaceae bacterium]